jgi:predicted TIM-barrel fold metal-dependent hydrolase
VRKDYQINLPPRHLPEKGTRSKLERRGNASNDYLAEQVAKHPKRFAAFCALSMHDPQNACEELTRCVTEYGMVGAMINDFQTGSDGKAIFYDGPEYDLFWKTVQELDVVVYIHPRFPHPDVIQSLFGGRRALLGACWYIPDILGAVADGQELFGGCGNSCSWTLYEWCV